MNKHISNIRLKSHLLTDTQQLTPRALVARMGAMQAQDYTMAKWGVGIRLSGYTDRSVEEAFNRGEMLRTHVMRPTWHFVAPENIRWMLPLSAERIKASAGVRDKALEITESVYTEANDVIQKALATDGFLTRDRVGEALERAGIRVDSSRMVHFMLRAETEGLVCSGPLQGKVQTYALMDDRAPLLPPLHREEALAKLARIYFIGHGAATLQDYMWWSGLSQKEAKLGLEAVKPELCEEVIDGQTYWIANELANVAQMGYSIHLLPAFDEYIIGYRERGAVLSPENQRKAISSNGIFRPTVVVDGQVAGLWRKNPAAPSSPIFDFKEPFVPSNVMALLNAITAFERFYGGGFIEKTLSGVCPPHSSKAASSAKRSR
jgi:hypothetical protein